jgi:hypothetical protein
MPKYVIDTPSGKQQVETDSPVQNAAEMEYAMGPPSAVPNPRPTPGYGDATLAQGISPDYGNIATTLRLLAPLLGDMLGGPAGGGIGTALAEPFARKMEGGNFLEPTKLPPTDLGASPDELTDLALNFGPGAVAGVVQKNSKRALPFTGHPWTGVEGEKVIPLRRPHAYLPREHIPDELSASATRDEHGNLIRIYHGTRGLNDQQALDPDKLSEPWFNESGGLYGTEQPSITTGYSVRSNAADFEKMRTKTVQYNKKIKMSEYAQANAERAYQKSLYTGKNIPEKVTKVAKADRELIARDLGSDWPAGIQRADVVKRNPQSRPVYMNITQPFHVEKTVPRSEALNLLDAMLPEELSSNKSRMIETVAGDLFENLNDPYSSYSPDTVNQYLTDVWDGSESFDPIKDELTSVLQHPQVKLLLHRIRQRGISGEMGVGGVDTQDLHNQFMAALKAYMPDTVGSDRGSMVADYLNSNLRGSDTKTRERISGGEVLDVLKRNGIDTREALSKLGYDGITHIGGGPPAHRVWIAFRPDQIYDAIPLEAHAESKFKGLAPPAPIAPHSVINGPIWKSGTGQYGEDPGRASSTAVSKPPLPAMFAELEAMLKKASPPK